MLKLLDNRYGLIKTLGEGGFGRVFLAKEENSEELVAIKQLRYENKEKQDDILYEMQMIAKLNHPNIVTYKHNFVQDDVLFIVMEYCPKGSMRDLMHDEAFTSADFWKWMIILTETLQFVHSKRIIHHDIKPDNILFTEDMKLKISDFGIANTGGGTREYMSPEALSWSPSAIEDERVDIYALGVTLLELMTGKNPFSRKSSDEIIEIHDRKDFGITSLPQWQQEIILKAIDKIPEKRFQSMIDFYEAVKSESVSVVFEKDTIKAGDLAERAGKLLTRKKWSKAYTLLDYAEREIKPSVSVLQAKGKYFLMSNRIKEAKEYFEKSLKLNPRLDVQKELGWINLETKNYPTAISLLSDHLHRNPTDYEAYNLLLQCFYETNRYEVAMELARTLLDVDVSNQCIANNYYICCVMQNIGETFKPSDVITTKIPDNHFLNYNSSLILECKDQRSHNFTKEPTLKSKLLFMDYRFKTFSNAKLFFTNSNLEKLKPDVTLKPIITIGREGYSCNDIEVPGGSSISRRHCVIVNCKDDVWLYDLGSTGTYVNNEKVKGKIHLVGKNIIRIGKTEFEMTNDENKLL